MAVQRSTHPSADVLKAFALGKVNDNLADVVAVHLDQCPQCRQEVATRFGEDSLNRLRQPRGQSPTLAPGNTLANAARAAKPAVGPAPVCHVPPELEANPQYEILRELGRGGMGVVYLARNKLMDRLEVLKVVNKALLDHPGAVERFLREIRSAAKLSHPNVVAAHHALQQGELLAFAMEYVEGQDLASLVKSQGPLPVQHACYYVQQAASGLQHAFEKGMVHRDIKPQNLILAREGKKHIVKVLDFGLAKVMREKSEDTGLTGEGKMLGTPDYIAPEQTLDAAKADIRADIYSLGCTLYYLLSGRPPFSAASLGAILLAHQMQEARALNLVRPEVPEELAAVVRKMMAKSPAQRYQTPLEVVQALAPFIKQGPTPKSAPELSSAAVETKPTQTVRPPVPRKKGLLGVGVGVLLLALVGMLAGGVFMGKTERLASGEKKPSDDLEARPGEKSLGDLVVADSVWSGTIDGIKAEDPENFVKENGKVILYVERGNGSTFSGVIASHGIENEVLQRSLRPVRGNIKENSLDFHSVDSDHFRVTGTWKNGCLEITYRRFNGDEATAQLKPDQTRPKSAAPVLSVFRRNDSEGWYTLGQSGNKRVTQPIVVDSLMPPDNQHDDYHWLFARCFPGNPNEWGWHAPHKYHGDHSGKFGRCLMYDIYCDQVGDPPETDWYVRLEGAAMILFLDGTTLQPPVDKVWKHYCVRLDPSAGWKKEPGGEAATDADIKKVLADVTDLRIKGEFGVKSDGCLGTVEFGADDPVKKD